MKTERNNKIVLGVSGSVAAYRAADLARDLMRAGADVRVCLTQGALRFVTAQLFEALTGNPVLTSVFEEPVPGRMAHIDWARWADLVIVAPASANTLAKVAHGIADDMLTTLISATNAPILVAPAMNPQMFVSDANREAIHVLLERGVTIVEPKEGDVACGEHGQGKLANNATICEAALEILQMERLYEGRRILITSGPTQEPIDSVRYLSNRSSGKMGAALARAGLLMGAEVTVIAGPSSAVYPIAAKIKRVVTTAEMLEAAAAEAEQSDLIIGAAAVADFRPKFPVETKIRRSDQSLNLELEENPDILAVLFNEFPNSKIVGFAAEPSEDLDEAKQKIIRKGLLAIAANDVSNPEIGFESNNNELNLVFADGSGAASGRRSKFGCAVWLLKTLHEKSL